MKGEKCQLLVYDDDWLTDFVANYKLKLQEKFGIRHFYGISQNAEIKETDNWYQPMLKLEQKVAKDQTLYPVARLQHEKILQSFLYHSHQVFDFLINQHEIPNKVVH